MGKLRRGLFALAALALVALLVRAAEPWERPATEWTPEDALAILTNSPWAEEVRLRQATGRLLAVFFDGLREFSVVYQENRSGPTRRFSRQPSRVEPETVEAVYAVRWSSAATVEKALRRLQEHSSTVAELQAPPSEMSDQHYVLTARIVKPPAETPQEASRRLQIPLDDSGEPLFQDEAGRPVFDRPPRVADLFAGLGAEELKARAELRTSKKLRVKPDRVVRHGLGVGEGISFFFPRQAEDQPTLPPGTEWAEFVFEGVTGTELKVKFKLKEMRVNGEPDH